MAVVSKVRPVGHMQTVMKINPARANFLILAHLQNACRAIIIGANRLGEQGLRIFLLVLT